MIESCDVAIIGSGFAGSLLARILTVLGYDVVLLERGTHPRFAIGESSTPLANLSLERLAARYGLSDCHQLATHGRWLSHYPGLRRGLKRGFTFYRHHPNEPFANRGLDSERLLVAASPHDSVSDSHWLRADVDQHFVRRAAESGVDYRDRTEVTSADIGPAAACLKGSRNGRTFELRANFVVDASGPGGFLGQQLAIPSALHRTHTRSALVFSHFDGVRMMADIEPDLPAGPYPDDWAAVHHLIDEGWMYSLRFDHRTTSAGFLLTPHGLASLDPAGTAEPAAIWRALLHRYPTLTTAFGDAVPLMPIGVHRSVQHRLSQAAGGRWLLLPHAYAFVDPLFSTGIAWSLRAVERIALAFEAAAPGCGRPDGEFMARYDAMLDAEANQIDLLVAGAYEAMAHFELFAAHAMLYFATVSFAEAQQRLAPDDGAPWKGFLGVGDPILQRLAGEARRRLAMLTSGEGNNGSGADRKSFSDWVTDSIRDRNVAGLADPKRLNLYPVDLDALVDAHELFGMPREQVIASLPALRGMGNPS